MAPTRSLIRGSTAERLASLAGQYFIVAGQKTRHYSGVLSAQVPSARNRLRLARVPGSVARVLGSVARVPGSVARVPASVARVPRSVARVPGSVARVPGSVARVPGSVFSGDSAY
jgi:hypothetical protein